MSTRRLDGNAHSRATTILQRPIGLPCDRGVRDQGLNEVACPVNFVGLRHGSHPK
jgi:hypothetical protein